MKKLTGMITGLFCPKNEKTEIEKQIEQELKRWAPAPSVELLNTFISVK